MDLAKALGIDFDAPPPGRGLVVAFVGAGGKTSALFALAAEAIREDAGGAPRASGHPRVIVTTTTRIADPRLEAGRPPLKVILAPELAAAEPPRGGAAALAEAIRGGARNGGLSRAEAQGDAVVVVASGEIPADPESGAPAKLAGIRPPRCAELAALCDLLLVEADGSRGRPVKAPGEGEPAVPTLCDIIVGVVGLDCLGESLGEAIAHRPGIFGPLAGCAPGEAIRPRHVAALIRAPGGLFKGAPTAARKILLLNKADASDAGALRELLALLSAPLSAAGETAAGLGARCGRVAVCSLKRGEILETLERSL